MYRGFINLYHAYLHFIHMPSTTKNPVDFTRLISVILFFTLFIRHIVTGHMIQRWNVSGLSCIHIDLWYRQHTPECTLIHAPVGIPLILVEWNILQGHFYNISDTKSMQLWYIHVRVHELLSFEFAKNSSNSTCSVTFYVTCYFPVDFKTCLQI